MIQLVIFGEDFEQDIKPLIKAFYPEESIKAYVNSDEIISPADMLIRMKLLPDKFFVYITGDETDEASGIADISDKKAYRALLARTLYDMLSKRTKKILPWGTLTGVRPVKLLYEMLDRGKQEDAIINYMKEQYYCSDEKIKKGIIIARRERQILEQIDYRNGYSLYIGIPFCPTTCAYCSFASYPLNKHSKYVEPYLLALFKEIEYSNKLIPNKKLNTVYIGGGTPTALTEEQLERLLIKIRDCFPIHETVEFCVEAGRPDSITLRKLMILKQYGVNRISINPQSMVQRTLDIIGRNHSASEIEDAFIMAREAGHDNINMDTIIGLTGEIPDDVRYTMEQISKLSPDSLTVHTLALKRAARLSTHKELYVEHETAGVEEMYRITEKYARDEGYMPYYLYRQKNMSNNLENIGYAKHGKEGIYNILIMEEKQTILALGAAASTKYVSDDLNRIERVENVKSLQDYIKRIDEMINRKTEFLKLFYTI